jgi:hypothetical protein
LSLTAARSFSKASAESWLDAGPPNSARSSRLPTMASPASLTWQPLIVNCRPGCAANSRRVASKRSTNASDRFSATARAASR